MKTKNLSGIFVLFLCTLSLIGCHEKDEFKDKVETIRMYVSSETSTYVPWGSDQPVECMLVKEEGRPEYSKLSFKGITGFTYEQGHEYVLKVENRPRLPRWLTVPVSDTSCLRLCRTLPSLRRLRNGLSSLMTARNTI